MKIKLPKELQKKWLIALESGRYAQTKSRLYDETEKSYCCLGVLARQCNIPIKNISDIGDFAEWNFDFKYVHKIPSALIEVNKKEESVKNTTFCNTLIFMNDGNCNFKEIAAYIEDKTIGI